MEGTRQKMEPGSWRPLARTLRELSLKEIADGNLFLRITAICLYKLDSFGLVLVLVLSFCSLFAFEKISGVPEVTEGGLDSINMLQS